MMFWWLFIPSTYKDTHDSDQTFDETSSSNLKENLCDDWFNSTCEIMIFDVSYYHNTT